MVACLCVVGLQQHDRPWLACETSMQAISKNTLSYCQWSILKLNQIHRKWLVNSVTQPRLSCHSVVIKDSSDFLTRNFDFRGTVDLENLHFQVRMDQGMRLLYCTQWNLEPQLQPEQLQLHSGGLLIILWWSISYTKTSGNIVFLTIAMWAGETIMISRLLARHRRTSPVFNELLMIQFERGKFSTF